ncbi:acetylornithine deacetylase [Bacillus sp. M6-12]|uniref:peptidase n=1 Tax=Bacillus sp. M6-12 TaxID=2054166 RepID=UPI000C765F16|nr:peptidase [Bacillus sp. M6-12]PLS16238.1 acetylornithine deacetylase [Bacillus sp. M6-12]
MESKEKVKNWLKENRNNGVKFLQRLVQEPSRRGQEGKAQAIIVEKCRELGLSIDLWELGGEMLTSHANFHCDRSQFEGNPNLAAVKSGTGGGKSIILNSHIDVVPEGNLKDWDNDPFSGIVKDGKVYGRGATDMKGGTVSLLLALESLHASGIDLKGDVVFQSVIEEESGGAGTLAAVLRGYKADGAIIPEPTNMKLFPLQQGSMWFRITVKGKSAHGGTRYEGVSAIEQAMKVITELQKLEKARNIRLNHPLYKSIPIPIPINIGKLSSGEWPSSVPDIAVIEGRMGIAPTERVKDAEQDLEDCICSLNSEDAWFSTKPVELEWFGARWLPGSLELNHPLMEVLSKNFTSIIGENPLIEASPWGTDGGILSNVGEIPVVVFGPGTTAVAHDANEFIEISKVIEVAEVIACTLIDWCGEAGKE